MRVGVRYLEWAHGPAADDGHPPAVAIMELCNGRKIVQLPLDDRAIRDELLSVAELWDHPDTEDLPAMRTARRIRNTILALDTKG